MTPLDHFDELQIESGAGTGIHEDELLLTQVLVGVTFFPKSSKTKLFSNTDTANFQLRI